MKFCFGKATRCSDQVINLTNLTLVERRLVGSSYKKTSLESLTLKIDLEPPVAHTAATSSYVQNKSQHNRQPALIRRRFPEQQNRDDGCCEALLADAVLARYERSPPERTRMAVKVGQQAQRRRGRRELRRGFALRASMMESRGKRRQRQAGPLSSAPPPHQADTYTLVVAASLHLILHQES